MVEQVRSSQGLHIGRARIASVTVLPDLYERRAFTPAWTSAEATQQLVRAIDDIAADGLDPEDYHRTEIARLRARIAAGESDPNLPAELDIVQTDALIRLGYHVLFGKVDPEALDSNWNLAREIEGRDPAERIADIIRSGDIARAIAERKPQFPAYERLKAALAHYRAIQKAGGWKPVPAGPTLRKGMDDARVLALRARLAATGDLAAGTAPASLFDAALERAVKQFQDRHYLDPDGAVGKGTIAAMNVPVGDRIDQIRVNLERARWVLHDVPETFVIVDIAGFGLRLFQHRQPVWSARVQVGKPYRKTPVLRADIKYLVLNPTWTIPPGILKNDTLPAVKRDPRYLASRNLRVVDAHGKTVDPRSIDWSRYPREPFPYQLVQAPGPDNALGRVKFIFPNPHFVFLHDTPSRDLFEKTERAFSSGCIRVENPIELAELLLNNPEKWSRATISGVIESGETQTIFLPETVPVFLLYWTVNVEKQGEIRFKKDLYGRDAAVLKALNGAFKFRKRPVGGRPRL